MSKLTVWLNSGANIHSCLKQTFEWDELGITEQEWDAMTEDNQEKFARDLAFERADWGYTKEQP